MTEKIQEILKDLTGNDKIEINEKTNILTDIDINSYDLIEMVCRIEDEFDVEISDKQAKSFKTVGDVISFIKENQK